MALDQYRHVIDFDDVPQEKLRDIVYALLHHLDLVIVEESTPDYTLYEVQPRVALEAAAKVRGGR